MFASLCFCSFNLFQTWSYRCCRELWSSRWDFIWHVNAFILICDKNAFVDSEIFYFEKLTLYLTTMLCIQRLFYIQMNYLLGLATGWGTICDNNPAALNEDLSPLAFECALTAAHELAHLYVIKEYDTSYQQLYMYMCCKILMSFVTLGYAICYKMYQVKVTMFNDVFITTAFWIIGSLILG